MSVADEADIVQDCRISGWWTVIRDVENVIERSGLGSLLVHNCLSGFVRMNNNGDQFRALRSR